MWQGRCGGILVSIEARPSGGGRARRRAKPLRATLPLAAITAACLALFAAFAEPGRAQSASEPSALFSAEDPSDWPIYNRSYRGWRYSPLSEINRENVHELEVAWIHQPGAIIHGLQVTPLALDGVVYTIGPYNRVFALDGATGKKIWHYYPDLDPVVEELFFAPYSRGVALGHGKVYVATLDGRGVALDMKTGEEVWQTKLLDPWECAGCTFTSPPTVAGETLVFGPTGGDSPQRGKIYGLDAETGEPAWVFETLKDDPASWTKEAIETGGGGAWMPGSYDPETHTVFYGTGNPAPDFDWGAARPGDNLYTSSVVALDPDSGALKWYHQEIPHDLWDYDSATGEFIFLRQEGKTYLVHPNKGGFVFVYERDGGKIENVWPLAESYNFVERIDPASGALVGRNEPKFAEKNVVCPWLVGAKSWNQGAYHPGTGLWYVPAMEACHILEIQKIPAEEVPLSGVWFGGTATATDPPGGKAYGRLDARDPLSGERKWSVTYEIPLLSGVLATGGDLIFVGDLHGMVHAYDAETGKHLWAFNTGSGIRGGLISYAAEGRQYILVPSGSGSHALGFFAQLWPELVDAPSGAALIAFRLKD